MNIDTPVEILRITTEPVGYYDLGGTRFAINKKPCWLHRFLVRWVFGWEWVEK